MIFDHAPRFSRLATATRRHESRKRRAAAGGRKVRARLSPVRSVSSEKPRAETHAGSSAGSQPKRNGSPARATNLRVKRPSSARPPKRRAVEVREDEGGAGSAETADGGDRGFDRGGGEVHRHPFPDRERRLRGVVAERRQPCREVAHRFALEVPREVADGRAVGAEASQDVSLAALGGGVIHLEDDARRQLVAEARCPAVEARPEEDDLPAAGAREPNELVVDRPRPELHPEDVLPEERNEPHQARDDARRGLHRLRERARGGAREVQPEGVARQEELLRQDRPQTATRGDPSRGEAGRLRFHLPRSTTPDAARSSVAAPAFDKVQPNGCVIGRGGLSDAQPGGCT